MKFLGAQRSTLSHKVSAVLKDCESKTVGHSIAPQWATPKPKALLDAPAAARQRNVNLHRLAMDKRMHVLFSLTKDRMDAESAITA